MLTEQDKQALKYAVRALKLLNSVSHTTKPSTKPLDNSEIDANFLLYQTYMPEVSEARKLAKFLGVALVKLKSMRESLSELSKCESKPNTYLINEITENGKLIRLYWGPK